MRDLLEIVVCWSKFDFRIFPLVCSVYNKAFISQYDNALAVDKAILYDIIYIAFTIILTTILIF